MAEQRLHLDGIECTAQNISPGSASSSQPSCLHANSSCVRFDLETLLWEQRGQW